MAETAAHEPVTTGDWLSRRSKAIAAGCAGVLSLSNYERGANNDVSGSAYTPELPAT